MTKTSKSTSSVPDEEAGALPPTKPEHKIHTYRVIDSTTGRSKTVRASAMGAEGNTTGLGIVGGE